MISSFSIHPEIVLLFAGLAMIVVTVSFINISGLQSQVTSRKAKQSKAMKEAFKVMEGRSESSKNEKTFQVRFLNFILERVTDTHFRSI